MSASPQATFSGPHLIFVLAGQSNMAGRGALDQALPQNPRVLLLSGEDGQGQWQVSLALSLSRSRAASLSRSLSRSPQALSLTCYLLKYSTCHDEVSLAEQARGRGAYACSSRLTKPNGAGKWQAD
jgi:hypothetical protein